MRVGEEGGRRWKKSGRGGGRIEKEERIERKVRSDKRRREGKRRWKDSGEGKGRRKRLSKGKEALMNRHLISSNRQLQLCPRIRINETSGGTLIQRIPIRGPVKIAYFLHHWPFLWRRWFRGNQRSVQPLSCRIKEWTLLANGDRKSRGCRRKEHILVRVTLSGSLCINSPYSDFFPSLSFVGHFKLFLSSFFECYHSSRGFGIQIRRCRTRKQALWGER